MNILLILFYNVFKTLNQNYMLISSDKISLRNIVPPVSGIIADLAVCAFVGVHLHTCIVLHGYFSLLVRPVDQQWRQLALRFYSKWYCATSGVDVLARRFRLASNRYIVCESANIKVCWYQVMMSNGLFEKTNEQHMFSKVFCN